MMIRALLVLGFCLALVSCGHSQPVGLEEARHAPEFDTITESVTVSPDEAGMAKLDVLLARHGARYGDRLVVAADTATRDTVRARYVLSGIRVLPAPGDALEPGAPIRATFVRLLVTPPACGDWSDGPKTLGDNRVASDWGCANEANLARMVADPNDLIAGRAPSPAYNAQADAVAVRAYRAKTIEWELAPSGTTGE
jgi:pilus assembly protein CpaD